MSYLAQIGITASAKFETASKISIYRKSFDIVFAFIFQISLFGVCYAILSLSFSFVNKLDDTKLLQQLELWRMDPLDGVLRS